jgi:hypothetical protein
MGFLQNKLGHLGSWAVGLICGGYHQKSPETLMIKMKNGETKSCFGGFDPKKTSPKSRRNTLCMEKIHHLFLWVLIYEKSTIEAE